MFLTLVFASAATAALVQPAALSVLAVVSLQSLKIVLIAAFTVTVLYMWRRLKG